MDEFRAGVTACLRSWSALRTAVQNEWGGPTSIEKGEMLREEIINSMIQKKMTDIFDLEDALAIFMEEEFSIVLDDNSEKQVANTVFQMFDEACSLNQSSAFALQIIQMAEKVTKEFGHLPLHIQYSEPMEEDGDDVDENDMCPDDNMEMNTNVAEAVQATSLIEASSNVLTSPADYASQPLFGLSREQRRLQILQKNEQPLRQLGETVPEPEQQKIVADEDGFFNVSTSRRGKPK